MMRCEPPSDDQLALITRMCHERGIFRLVIVYSKQDASQIIDALIANDFDPALHAGPWRFIGGIRDELPACRLESGTGYAEEGAMA